MDVIGAHAIIANHCADIAALFRPGVRVTVIVRNPGHGVDGSADLLVGDDDPDLLIAAIQYLRTRPERTLS